jgi:RHS repeat-associated protein
VPTAPGGTISANLEFTWQGKRLIGTNLYDSRARVWSADLGVFLQPDEYGFLTRTGTLWSWPGQNPFRWRDPSGRSGELADWFYANTGWIDEVAPALATAGIESDVAPLMAVGEASLMAMNVIDAVASLDAQRQSAAAMANASSDDEKECRGDSKAKADHREKTRGANKSDSKQIDDAARQAGVQDRRGFGKFIEAEKHATGQDPSDNFTYDELLDLAEQFKNDGGS